MSPDVIFHRWAQVHAIHAANHIDHEKRVLWFSISMLACGSLPMVMMLRLSALQAAGAAL